jgi:hypothetical protein
MNSNEKAVKLVKITFDKIAKASKYKGIKNGDDKKFGLIEKIAKEISIEYVNEMIAEFKNSDSLYATNYLVEYWEQVKQEIENL